MSRYLKFCSRVIKLLLLDFRQVCLKFCKNIIAICKFVENTFLPLPFELIQRLTQIEN